jgi:hypothetical protein
MIDKLDNRVLYIGIGLVFYLFLTTYAFLFQDWFRIIALFLGGFSPIPLFIFKELVYLIFCILVSFLFLNYLKKNKNSSQKLFVHLAIFMVIGQILQFITYPILNMIETEEYAINYIEYSEATRSEAAFSIISPARFLVLDILLIFLFYKNRNLLIQLDPNSEEIETIGK